MRFDPSGRASAREPQTLTAGATRTSILVEEDGDKLLLRDRRRPVRFFVTVGASLLFWWSFWTVGCVLIVARTIMQPNLENILFAVPFLDVWFFVLVAMCIVLFGRTCLRLGPDGLEESWRVLRFERTRHFRLDEIKGITEYEYDDDSESGQTRTGLKIATLGKSVRFALDATCNERSHLIALVDEHLRALRAHVATRGAFVDSGLRPPSDSEIALEAGFDRWSFSRTSPWRAGRIAGMTFFNLFWNGCVAVFAWQLVQHFMWYLCLFLIPFAVIGALMLISLLAEIASPLRRSEWSIDADSVTTRFSIWGFGRTRTYNIREIARIELRLGAGNAHRVTIPRLTDETEDRTFALSVVDQSGKNVFVINELTQGEGQWMERAFRAALNKHRASAKRGETGGGLWDRWVDGPAAAG